MRTHQRRVAWTLLLPLLGVVLSANASQASPLLRYDPATGSIEFEGLDQTVGLEIYSLSGGLLGELANPLQLDDIADSSLAPHNLAWLNLKGYSGTLAAGNLVDPGTPLEDLRFNFVPALGLERLPGSICDISGLCATKPTQEFRYNQLGLPPVHTSPPLEVRLPPDARPPRAPTPPPEPLPPPTQITTPRLHYNETTGTIEFTSLEGAIGLEVFSLGGNLLGDLANPLQTDDLSDRSLAPHNLSWLNFDGYHGSVNAGALVSPGTPLDDLRFNFVPALGYEVQPGELCSIGGYCAAPASAAYTYSQLGLTPPEPEPVTPPPVPVPQPEPIEPPIQLDPPTMYYDSTTGTVEFSDFSGAIGLEINSINGNLLGEAITNLVGDDYIDSSLAPHNLAWLDLNGYSGNFHAGPIVAPGTPVEDLRFNFVPGLGHERQPAEICTLSGDCVLLTDWPQPAAPDDPVPTEPTPTPDPLPVTETPPVTEIVEEPAPPAIPTTDDPPTDDPPQSVEEDIIYFIDPDMPIFTTIQPGDAIISWPELYIDEDSSGLIRSVPIWNYTTTYDGAALDHNLTVVLNSFDAVPTTNDAPVPEPAAIAIAACCVALLTARRRARFYELSC